MIGRGNLENNFVNSEEGLTTRNHVLPLTDSEQNVPSRSWGEDFGVQAIERDGAWFKGIVDNPLYEARLHELRQGEVVYFHEDHILAVHGIHRQELLMEMAAADSKVLAEWLGSQEER